MTNRFQPCDLTRLRGSIGFPAGRIAAGGELPTG
jgi:hypothetical protein